jgi:RNA polymerase sigma factor (sigma-70 family)
MTDSQLLSEYVRAQDQRAFATLVERHSKLVYSAALRRTGDAHLADDVTQAVFVILARKAPALLGTSVLVAWLYKTTRYASMDALKLRGRRERHERKAAEMRVNAYDPEMEMKWPRVAELLDAAIDGLSESDRRAVLLRYYENRSFAEVGEQLGVAEEAARKRVNRATERLRAWLARRGAVTGMSLLVTMLSTRLCDAAPLTAPLPINLSSVSAPSWANPSAAVDELAGQTLRRLAIAEARGWAITGTVLAALAIILFVLTYLWLGYDPPPQAPPVSR